MNLFFEFLTQATTAQLVFTLIAVVLLALTVTIGVVCVVDRITK